MRKLLLGSGPGRARGGRRRRRVPVDPVAAAEMGGRARRHAGDRAPGHVRRAVPPARLAAADDHARPTFASPMPTGAQADELAGSMRSTPASICSPSGASNRIEVEPPDGDPAAAPSRGRARTAARTGPSPPRRRAGEVAATEAAPTSRSRGSCSATSGSRTASSTYDDRASEPEPAGGEDRSGDHPGRCRPAAHARRRADHGRQARHPGRQRGPAAGRGRRRAQPRSSPDLRCPRRVAQASTAR